MQRPLTHAEVIDGAISPFADYCDGYGNPGSSGVGYVSVLKLSTGTVVKSMDSVLEGIVSYDRAEKNDAYAGQINMITASSFSGLNGVVWGYDVARHDGLIDGSVKPLFHRTRHDGVEIPIYPVEPLLEAGERLFGTASISIASRITRDLRDQGRDRERSDNGVVRYRASVRRGSWQRLKSLHRRRWTRCRRRYRRREKRRASIPNDEHCREHHPLR